MRVFVYAIAAERDGPPEEMGYVRVGTAKEAVAVVGHPEVNVYHLPVDAEWPGGVQEVVCCWP